MNKATIRAKLRALKDAFGVRDILFHRASGSVVAKIREDKAVDLFLATMGGERLPDAAARALARAEEGTTDMTAVVVKAARLQVATDEQDEADRKAAEGDTL